MNVMTNRGHTCKRKGYPEGGVRHVSKMKKYTRMRMWRKGRRKSRSKFCLLGRYKVQVRLVILPID